MRMGYEVRSGKREVAFQYASTPQEALIEYLRSIGCRDDEVVRLGLAPSPGAVRSSPRPPR